MVKAVEKVLRPNESDVTAVLKAEINSLAKIVDAQSKKLSEIKQAILKLTRQLNESTITREEPNSAVSKHEDPFVGTKHKVNATQVRGENAVLGTGHKNILWDSKRDGSNGAQSCVMAVIVVVRTIGVEVTDRCARDAMDVYSAVVCLCVYKRCVTKYMNQHGCGVPT
ncbi:hypothetical protein SeLEV6574_g01212 [Synchytrium endobioticum]|nr:hypothetical protein SeLEV6574_g01212 [Synchytrium endobioticum]